MRLIDADAIPYTMLYKENWMAGTGKEAQGVWKSEIDKMPTVEERKTGKWKISDLPKGKMKYCSECGYGQFMADIRKYNFCPNCGARMEE